MFRIRRNFLAGVLVLVPLIISFFVLRWLFELLDGIIGGLLAHWVTLPGGIPVPGLGLAALVLLILFTGFLANSLIGQTLVDALDRLMDRIPLARSIYNATKQLSQTLLDKQSNQFSQVVLAPFAGARIFGFVTKNLDANGTDASPEDLLVVFVPTAPNPTTGFVLVYRRFELLPLDISVEEVIRISISGGSVIEPGSVEQLKRVRDQVRPLG